MHGDARNTEKGMYKTKSGKLIEENKTVKDLGVITSRDVSFSEHIDDLVLSTVNPHLKRRWLTKGISLF